MDRMEGWVLKFIAILVLALLAGAAIAGYVVYTPYGPATETFVDIAPGTGSSRIAAQLAGAGVIRSRYVFAFERLKKGGTLKAGEYRFDHAATPEQVYDRLLHGDVYTLSLSIPEGFNLFDIAQAVETAGLGSKGAFLAAARQHTELIAAWNTDNSAPQKSLEGYLYPDTYHFSRHATPVQMLTAMVKRFRQEAALLGLTGDVSRTVVMASLIEKEVKQANERPLVASVFENRLAQGMPLATDPTVIYAAMLDGQWRGTIYASDLQSDSPYNTYRHRGLPPGPICSPGAASLRAAMHPATSDYLYFVSDAAGHSRFSAGLKEHASQVKDYRKATKHGR
jgi:UPF0755 protein